MELKACSSSKIENCCGHEKVKGARDTINEMPDAILSHILSSLPTRDSVGTSILSKRWRNVWTSVPVIKIDGYSLCYEYYKYQRRQSGFTSPDFKDWFMNFVDRVLLPSHSLSYEVSCVRKLRLRCFPYFDLSRVGKWIEVVTKLDDLEELDLSFSKNQEVKLPPSIYTCKKLVILKLAEKVVLNFPLSVCLPSLKEVHLLSVINLDVDSVKNFLIGCPVLEELRIERCFVDNMGMKTLCVQSSSLKSLTFDSESNSSPLLKLVIDASNLVRLDLFVDWQQQVDVKSSLSSLVTIKLDVYNHYTKSKGMHGCEINVLELLMKISNTKYLYVSAPVVESLHLRSLDYFPMLKNLRHCKVDIFSCSWPILCGLLESSPNLISFVCYKDFFGGCQELHGQFHLPKCVMLYLEEIELHRFGWDGYEMELVSYFLENAPALKKMFITLDEYLNPEVVSDLHGKVLKLPKASSACEIYVRNN